MLSHKRQDRKRRLSTRNLSPFFLLGSITLIAAISAQGSHAASDSRRPPPPPPPRSAGLQKQAVDDWQQQQQQHDYAYPEKNDTESDLPYAEPRETSYYSEESVYPPPQEGDSSTWYNDNDGNDDSFPRVSEQPHDNEGPYYAGPPRDDNEFKSQSNSIPRPPIHYEFPAAKTEADERIRRDGRDYGEDDDDNPSPATASARRDVLTRYWSTKSGKLQIMTCSTLIGAAFGNFLGNSLIGSTNVYIAVTALLFWISTWFRTPLGELIRAMGLSILLVLQRSRRIRKTYPTWKYIPAALGLTSDRRGLRPFPPARNPWKYVPRDARDPDFNMSFVLVAMAFVGSMVGGNLPVIPTWMGALAGASTFAYTCTWQSPRGDLARSCGMRVVSALGELWEIQSDLGIIPKATVVSSQIIDKAMILDRKHRVKDRFLAVANKGYEQASRIATQIHDQQRGGNASLGEEDGGRRNRRPGEEDYGRDDPRRVGEDFLDSKVRRGRGFDADSRYERDSRDRLPPSRRPRPDYGDRGNNRDRFDERDDRGRDFRDRRRDDRDELEQEPEPPRKKSFWRR